MGVLNTSVESNQSLKHNILSSSLSVSELHLFKNQFISVQIDLNTLNMRTSNFHHHHIAIPLVVTLKISYLISLKIVLLAAAG
jgi:hypothetical protein